MISVRNFSKILTEFHFRTELNLDYLYNTRYIYKVLSSDKRIHVTHVNTPMDQHSGLYSDSKHEQWATLQAVPINRELIKYSIEIGLCQVVSQWPRQMTAGGNTELNLGLLEQEIPGYSLYEALTSPTNWCIFGKFADGSRQRVDADLQ